MRMRHVVMWSVRLYDIFSHYLVNGTIFGKTLWNINIYLDVLYKFRLKHFFIVRTEKI